MKIIDKTPLQDANGTISFVARVQGTLKYGFSWYGELEAQKAVITQLDRSLEKGFVLIRNFTLPNSEIVIPMILIGTGGIWIISATPVKGSFEAKGDQWNVVGNGKSQPASINLLDRLSKLSRVLQKYVEIQKINLTSPVEPVLILTDPATHVDSMRPAARIVRSDAIQQFAASVRQARPVWRVEFIHDLADRLIDPQPRQELKPVAPEPVVEQQPASRAQAIFNSPDSAPPFDNNELGFAFDESDAAVSSQEVPQNLREPNPSRQLPRPAPAKGGFLGMSTMQVVILAGMAIFGCCIVGGLGMLLLNQ
jgi:hypothetical protein